MAGAMLLTYSTTPVMVRVDNSAAIGLPLVSFTQIAARTSRVTDNVSSILHLKGADVCRKFNQSCFHISPAQRLQAWASNDANFQGFRSACGWIWRSAWLGGALAMQRFIDRRTKYPNRARLIAASAADESLRMKEAHYRFSHAQGVDATRKGGILGGIVSQAVSIYIKQQLEEWSELRVRLGGGSRELLGGFVPSFALQTTGANFRGLVLSQCDLAADGISISLRSKSGGLLKRPFNARACVTISQSDLNSSISSPLLQSTLRQILAIKPSQPLPALVVTLRGSSIDLKSHATKTCIQLDVSNDGQWIRITNVTENRFPGGFSLREIDLGPGTRVETLQVCSQGVLMVGTFQITP